VGRRIPALVVGAAGLAVAVSGVVELPIGAAPPVSTAELVAAASASASPGDGGDGAIPATGGRARREAIAWPEPVTLPVPGLDAAPPLPEGVAPSPPAVVSLPRFGVAAAIDPVSVLPGGELQLPDDPRRVGWWVGGATPGDDTGSVVLAGHVDSQRYGTLGTFAVLHLVTIGDEVVVHDTAGRPVRYTVTGRIDLPKAELPESFFHRDGPGQLVLVTCGGTFDRGTRRYAENIIVLAQPSAT
jgi:hypothetical protein